MHKLRLKIRKLRKKIYKKVIKKSYIYKVKKGNQIRKSCDRNSGL